MSLPDFDGEGNLPVGIHLVSWNEFRQRFSGSNTRVRLIGGLEEGLRCLHDARCRTVYVDGSFVTNKSEPGDFDVCWEATDEIDADRLPPSIMNYENFPFVRAVQKQRYGGEFFIAGNIGGVDSASNTVLSYLEYFQRDKNNHPKGIVHLDLADMFGIEPNEGD